MQAEKLTRQPNAKSARELLTARDLEAMLKIDVKTTHMYVQEGLIPYVRIQSNVKFVREEILDWIKKTELPPGKWKRRPEVPVREQKSPGPQSKREESPSRILNEFGSSDSAERTAHFDEV